MRTEHLTARIFDRSRIRPVPCESSLSTKKGSTIREGDGHHAALGRSHGIVWENDEQTKLTMERSPKTKELRKKVV